MNLLCINASFVRICTDTYDDTLAKFKNYCFMFHYQIALQMLIIVTGNYNFFNLLTIALCISLVEDDFIKPHKGIFQLKS